MSCINPKALMSNISCISHPLELSCSLLTLTLLPCLFCCWYLPLMTFAVSPVWENFRAFNYPAQRTILMSLMVLMTSDFEPLYFQSSLSQAFPMASTETVHQPSRAMVNWLTGQYLKVRVSSTPFSFSAGPPARCRAGLGREGKRSCLEWGHYM